MKVGERGDMRYCEVVYVGYRFLWESMKCFVKDKNCMSIVFVFEVFV